MTVTAIIQARCGSTRLPNKIFREFEGHSSLWHQIQRIRRSHRISEIIIATTIEPQDDAIEIFCKSNSLRYFRGSENDVLDRYYQTIKSLSIEGPIVRITADCPLIDPEIIDRTIDCFLRAPKPFDYLTNTTDRTFPIGMDVEVLTVAALERAHRECRDPALREHVTAYIYKSGQFNTGSYRNEGDNAYTFQGSTELGKLRLTLDTPEDFDLISAIYKELWPIKGSEFGLNNIMAVLEKSPALLELNRQVLHRHI